MVVECKCKDWKENIPKINMSIEHYAMRYDTKGYEGKQLKYCPWCGHNLETKQTNNNLK